MRAAGKTLFITGAALLTLGSAVAWQMPWREYPGQDNIEVPPDYKVPAEWVFARLMYPSIPDAHFLFHADFKRAGSDLILTGEDGHRVVVPGYFKHEHMPTLLAPNGGAH